jgi:hypothetical protein
VRSLQPCSWRTQRKPDAAQGETRYLGGLVMDARERAAIETTTAVLRLTDEQRVQVLAYLAGSATPLVREAIAHLDDNPGAQVVTRSFGGTRS